MTPIEKIKLIITQVKAVNRYMRAYNVLSRREIINKFKSIGISPPLEVIKLYELHNGIYSLDSSFDLMEVEEAIEWYQTYQEIKIDNSTLQWQQNYLPLFSMNGDVILCLDCQLFSVIAIDLELCRVEKIAEHYEHYLDAILNLFQQKLLFCNGGKFEVEANIWKDTCQLYKIKNAW